MSARRCWVTVACAEHAKRACLPRPIGFVQVCHGKLGPLKRLQAGDLITCYAPAQTMGGKDRLQSFVTLGTVQPGVPYAFDMGGGFVPFRRDVRYEPAHATPIEPLLDALDFVEDRRRWGYRFRFGLFEISLHDMALIAQAMGVEPTQLGLVTIEQAITRPDTADAGRLF
jgi:hypothetical protein